MLEANYDNTLIELIEDEDVKGANTLCMKQLTDALVDNKQGFVDLLNECDVEADMSMPKYQLIELFIENTNNKKCLVGASMLIEMSKKDSNFEGIDDDSVKNRVAVMDTYFNQVEPDEEYSYIAPFLVGALARGAGKLLGRSKGGRKAQDDMRALAERRMREQAILRQRVEMEQRQRALEEQKRRQRVNTYLIVGGLAVTSLIAFVILNKR